MDEPPVESDVLRTLLQSLKPFLGRKGLHMLNMIDSMAEMLNTESAANVYRAFLAMREDTSKKPKQSKL